MDLFEIDIIYPITTGLVDSEELSETQRLTHHLKDGYKIDKGYWNLIDDPICQLNPRLFLPNEGENNKYFTEVVFLSGSVSYAVGKPEAVLGKIKEYVTKK
jgi:hypothetical protein